MGKSLDTERLLSSLRLATDKLIQFQQNDGRYSANTFLYYFATFLPKNYREIKSFSDYSFTAEQAYILFELAQRHNGLLSSFLTLLATTDYKPNISEFIPYSREENYRFNVSPWSECNQVCPDSEDYLQYSIENETAVLINDHIVYKKKGTRAGLSLKTVMTSTGIMLENHWYLPKSPHVGTALNATTSRRIEILTSNWALLRPISTSRLGVTPEETINIAKEFLENVSRS